MNPIFSDEETEDREADILALGHRTSKSKSQEVNLCFVHCWLQFWLASPPTASDFSVSDHLLGVPLPTDSAFSDKLCLRPRTGFSLLLAANGTPTPKGFLVSSPPCLCPYSIHRSALENHAFLSHMVLVSCQS